MDIFLLIIAELLLVVLCVELMVKNLPAGLRAAMRANRQRMDGTESPSRTRMEEKA